MDKYQIHVDDIQRILQGEVPLEFYVELFLRGITIYLILISAFRLMGKRMSSRMTRNELAAVSSLAAAIGIPLQTPERGLLPGLVIAGLLVLMQRAVASRAAKNERFEGMTQGKISTLIADGELQLDDLRKCHMSRERIFEQLRGNKIRHLGEVQRLYLEASGSFTVIKQPEPPPGLCVLPESDPVFRAEQPLDTTKKVCSYCGYGKKKQADNACPNCHQHHWEQAIR